MSIISNIFARYQHALNKSQDRYEDAYKRNAIHARQFYDDFLNSLVLPLSSRFNDPGWRANLRLGLERFFPRREIDFVAIDGTCSKDPFQDFVVFFGGAYGVRGQISFEDTTSSVRYQRWSMDQDVSMVAYVPIPYAEVGDAIDDEEDFALSENDKIDLSNIHTRIMQLAEVYLAYQLARSSTIDHPRMILMDLSLSSVLMSTDVGMDRIGLVSEKGADTGLSIADVAVAYSHPISPQLDIPSTKRYRRYSNLVGKFHTERITQISIDDLVEESGITSGEWEHSLGFGTTDHHVAHMLFEKDGGTIKSLIDVRASWRKVIDHFETVCANMFQDRDSDSSDALLYTVSTPVGDRVRWMSPNDISFLIAVGLRALVEECWQRNIALVGIAKDSSSRYFSRHYYGVMRHIGIYNDIPVSTLPWTDRSLLESIAYQDDDLYAPWSTIEFDSCFMTLHMRRDQRSQDYVSGMRGDIVNQERLFARSLAQFYLKRDKPSLLAGHVIFIDRLLHPTWDRDKRLTEISSHQLGTINPFGVESSATSNLGHMAHMFLLDVLCKNLFPEVIGYPDPLHKADWGAKSMKRRVDRLIQSSAVQFRSRPLSRLFRSISESARRD